MNTKQTYNGWTNYETWVAKLWIDNDGMLNNYMEQVEEIYEDVDKDDTTFTALELTTMELRDRIKEYIDEFNPLPEAGMYSDLMNAALSEINYYEIAMSIVEDADLDQVDED